MTNLLIYRWLLLNICIAAVLSFPVATGVAARLFAEDKSYICHAIAVIFAVAMAWNLRECIRVSSWRNGFWRRGRTHMERASTPERDKAMSKLAWLDHVPEWLVGLGLLGTVLGFKVALGAVDQGSLASAQGVQTSIGTLMQGITIAINTTIAGAIAGLWLEVNNRILRTAAESYWADRRMP